MKITVNEAMIWMKAARGRLGELSSLRSESATKERWMGGSEPGKVKEPIYDMKELDKRCTEIENWLLEVETRIKQSNAITKIEVGSDVRDLLKPLS